MLIRLDIETFARALEEAEHLTPPLAAAATQQQPAPSNAEGSQTPSKSAQAPNPAPGDNKGQSNDKAPEKMDESWVIDNAAVRKERSVLSAATTSNPIPIHAFLYFS